MNITSTQLAQAAKLAENIEALTTALSTAEARVSELNAELSPLQSEYNAIMGTTGRKACTSTGTRKFSDEQRARISAGLKAKWAERKAKAATASAVDSTPADPDGVPNA